MYKENEANAMYEQYKQLLNELFKVAQQYRVLKGKNEEEVKSLYSRMSAMRDKLIKMSKQIKALNPAGVYVFADVSKMLTKGASPKSTLIWIKPMEFLRLAGNVGSIKYKLKERDTDSANTINKYYYNIIFGTIKPTELELSPDNTIIIRHDGRHRAYAAAMIPKDLKIPLEVFWTNKPKDLDLSKIMRQDDPSRPEKKGLRLPEKVKNEIVSDNVRTLKIALDKSTNS